MRVLHGFVSTLGWPSDGEVGTLGGGGGVPPATGGSSFVGIVPSAKPDVIIRRVSSRLDGMTGVLLLKDPLGYRPVCQTLEDPWNDNASGRSCIPEGLYNCALIQSPSKGIVYQVLSVPARTHILIHRGNTNQDTEGCILLGKEFGFLNGYVAVLESDAAFTLFMAKMKGAPQFVLSVEDVWGGSTAIKS